MTISRKIFSARVTVPPDAATSLYSMMRDSPAHWGYETTALTTPSMDSIIGSECGIVPDAPVFVGSDANVRAASSGSFYRGVSIAGGANYSLQDFGPGLIDPNQLYFYNQSGTQMDVTFTAR